MNNIMRIGSALILGGSLILSSCVKPGLTKQDVLRQYDTLAQFSDGVEDSRGRQGELLAPDQFYRTRDQLDEALGQARNAKKAEAMQRAKDGLIALDLLNEEIASNRPVMEEVLDMRARAVGQGANDLFPTRLQEADEHFQDASRFLEAGDAAKARDRRSALIDEYAQLELEALKKGKAETSVVTIRAAESVGAEEYAPKTLGLARDELNLVVSVLDADRTQTIKADRHATQATWLAHRAREIANLLQYFEEQEFSQEDRTLWYQGQLQQVRRALNDDTLPFDLPNAQVIVALQEDTRALQSVLSNMRETNELTRQQTASLEQEIVLQRQSHQAEMQKLLARRQEEALEAKERATRQLTALKNGSDSQLVQMANEMQKAKNLASERVDELAQRLSAQAQAQEEAERQRMRVQARFESVQGLFTEREAEVFRQGNDMVVRLKGFAFGSGRSDIAPNNYGLLNRVVSVLNTFPNALATVTGNTDNRGGEQRNLELSAARAQAVVKFLTSVGGVADGRLTAEGKGESQPVGNNDTAEGRAENRRIDVRMVVGVPDPV